MQEHGKSPDVSLDAFGYEQDGAKSLFEWISKLFPQKGNLFLGYRRKPASKYFLDLHKGFLVQRKGIVIYAANSEHYFSPK